MRPLLEADLKFKGYQLHSTFFFYSLFCIGHIAHNATLLSAAM